MTRGVRWCVVGACLFALAGCMRMWFAEREPWRGEAEADCMKSGAVRIGPNVTVLPAISGPGICGADYPLRVGGLGEPAVVGFADEVARPPGSVGGASRPSVAATESPAAPPARPLPGEPLSLAPPAYRNAAGGEAAPAPPYEGGRGAYAQSYPGSATSPPRPLLRAPADISGRPAATAIAAGPAAVTPPATLACPLVSVLDRFISEQVQPAALHWFGQSVVEIRQISSYSCRGMNGDPNAHISEHAFGNALDIAAFTLADGRKIIVKDGWHGSAEEQGFLHDVQGAACEVFTTVLAPGSNAFHYDHMHVDLMRRSSRRSICEPSPISGQLAAARAAGRQVRAGEPPFTGSLR